MTHGASLYRIPFPHCHLVAETCSPEDLPLVLTSCQRKWVVRILLECFTPLCHSVHREGGLGRPPPPIGYYHLRLWIIVYSPKGAVIIRPSCTDMFLFQYTQLLITEMHSLNKLQCYKCFK